MHYCLPPSFFTLWPCPARRPLPMRLTRTHLAYWQSRHIPDWASGLQSAKAAKTPNVHECINAHAGLAHQWSDLQEMIVDIRRLKSVQERRMHLLQIARGAVYSTLDRRVAHAARWLARIDRDAADRLTLDLGNAYGQEQTDSTEIRRALPGFSNSTLPIGRRSNSLARLLQAHQYRAHRNDA